MVWLLVNSKRSGMSDEDQPLVRVNAIGLFLIGMRIGQLESLWIQNPEYHNVAMAWRDLLAGLDLFIKQPYVPEGLGRCMKSAKALQAWCASLDRQFREYVKAQGFGPVPNQIAHGLVMRLDTFRTDLAGDTEELNLFLVPQRLAYDTRTLLVVGARIFGRRQAQIEEFAGPDVAEAYRAYALGAWTSAGFHILRACELVLEQLCTACGQTVPKDKGDWATLITLLGHKSVGTLPGGLKGRLTKLKDSHRNEIMHPRRFLDQTAVEELFDVAKVSLNEMLDEIARRRKAVR